MKRVRLVVGLLFGLLFIRDAGACQLTRLAVVPLTVIDGRILLGVAVNGKQATFQLDTGSARSLVTPASVVRLGLRRDRWVSATVEGIGGIERRSVADPATMTVAGIALHHDDPAGDAMLSVAPIAAPEVGGHVIDGLLGRDFLGEFDVELDLATHTLVLWRVHGCMGSFLPRGELGQSGYEPVPVLPAYGKALVVLVQANGTTLRAFPDTGSTESLLTASGMVRLGLREVGPRLLVGGVGERTRSVARLRLATLRVGDLTSLDVPILGTSLRIVPIVDMLLGADWFTRHPVWLSYATGQIFVGAEGPRAAR